MIAHAPVNVQELTDLDYMLLLYLRDNRGFHSPYTLSHELGEEGKTVARARLSAWPPWAWYARASPRSSMALLSKAWPR